MDTQTLTQAKKRFLGKVQMTDGCWLWTGWKGGQFRYGYCYFRGKHSVAHRVSYQLFVGEIPAGHFVCHHCDNPQCVRPDHLFAGTHTDNMRDMVRKGRGKGWGIRKQNGADNALAKLDDNLVRQIREEYSSGRITQRELAAKYGVTRPNISLIVNHHTWNHI